MVRAGAEKSKAGGKRLQPCPDILCGWLRKLRTMVDPLSQLQAILSSSLARPAKAQALAEAIREARGYHWVGLYDVGPDEIVAIAWTGPTPPAFPRFPLARGLNGAAVAARAPVVVQDVSQDPRWLTTFGTTRAEAIFPVSNAAGAVVGTIDVESEQVGVFGPADEAFLAAAADVLRGFWAAATPSTPSGTPGG